MPRFAANLAVMFPEWDFIERFAAAAAAGFPAVECLWPYDHPAAEIAARLRDSDLSLLQLNTPPGDLEAGDLGLAAVPGREAGFKASFGQALTTAQELSAQRIHVMAGVVSEADSAAAEETFRTNLAWALSQLGDGDPDLCIEPINSRDVPGYHLTRADQASRVIADLGHPRLGLQFDFYHAQVMHGDLTATLERHFESIVHVQVSGLPGRHEPDDRQEINHPYLFDLLDRKGYAGWVACEYSPRGSTLGGLKNWASAYGLGG